MVFKKGELYLIRFYDHCIGDTLLECEVVGWVFYDDEKTVRVTFWHIDDEEWKGENKEPVTILKSTIIRKKKLTGYSRKF